MLTHAAALHNHDIVGESLRSWTGSDFAVLRHGSPKRKSSSSREISQVAEVTQGQESLDPLDESLLRRDDGLGVESTRVRARQTALYIALWSLAPPACALRSIAVV